MKQMVFPLQPSSGLLFLNGQRTTLLDKHLLHSLNQYDAVVAVDGAWNDLQDSIVTQRITAVIGDGDSTIEMPPRFILINDQDTTDFEKALMWLVDNGLTSLDVFWGSGGEMDHFLGNLSVAVNYHQYIDVQFFDDFASYFLMTEDVCLSNVKDKTITVYPFPDVHISSKGLVYELSQHHLQVVGHQSLRNQADKDEVELLLYAGSAFVFVSR